MLFLLMFGAFIGLNIIIKSIHVYAADIEANSSTQEPVIKVLAIGNSFSEDATTYLQDIAKVGGMNIYVGNLYIGGCSLETHWNNVQNNEKAYTFFKYYDEFTTEDGVSIREALESQVWDFVVMQQVSQLSGVIASYEPYISNLSDYVKGLAPDAEQLIHQTWAYEKDSDHEGFVNYDKDQTLMFESLKEAYNQVSEKLGFRIIPCGEAMQNARETPVFDYSRGGESLCRDGFHASIPQGRYLLSAVWYEVITGKSILDNAYTVTGITESEIDILKQAAHDAVGIYDFKVKPTEDVGPVSADTR